MSEAELADRTDAALDAASGLLKALASPIRLAVIMDLAAGPRCVHELLESLTASQSLLSQHLRVLRGAGLVTTERRGREIAYRLADDHVAHIVRDAISHVQEDNASARRPRRSLGRAMTSLAPTPDLADAGVPEL